MQGLKITGLGAISAVGRGICPLSYLGINRERQVDLSSNKTKKFHDGFLQGQLDDEMARSGYAMSLIAIQDALEDSRNFGERVGLIIASGGGDTNCIEKATEDTERSAYDLASRLVTSLELKGTFCSISNACASTGYALDVARDMLAEGCTSVVVCGVECKSDTTLESFHSMLALDKYPCRPFSNSRNGTTLGSGAAAIVIATESSFSEKTYARIISSSYSCDAFHPTAPDPQGTQIKRCMESLLEDADTCPDQVRLFVPHATGTKLNDEIELKILREMFPDTFRLDATLLVKKWLGHTGGASGAFGIAYAAKSISSRYFEKDPLSESTCIVNSMAFGGNNSSTLLGPMNTRRA